MKPSLQDRTLLSPVILTGRGGSGTRLLSELAARCGLFLGNELNKSQDSLEWVEILYKFAIEKNRLHFENEQSPPYEKWREPLLQLAQNVLSAGCWQEDQPWGWKLPEAMLLIPELMAIFRHAKLVHLVRHPVSSSLRRTHKTSRVSSPIGRSVLRSAYRQANLDSALIDTHESHLNNAITWLFQVEQVSKYARLNLSAENYLEIRYEDLCRQPQSVQTRLTEFLGGAEMCFERPSIEHHRTGSGMPEDARATEIWALCEPVARLVGYSSAMPPS